MGMVLAVDLGGTKTALATVDERGVVHERRTFGAGRSLAESVAQIADGVRGFSPGPSPAIGIIVPGIYSHATGRAWCPNLWGLDEVPLRAALDDALHADVFIDSDRCGYVLGEAWLGAARGLRHVVFVAIGTGIGVGILADGALVRGVAGIAGAAGWFALDPRWHEDYGTTGCWEAESAGPGVALRAGQVDGRATVAAAYAGDASAQEALARAARFAGMGIANLISLLNPEAVVLGGGFLLGAADLLLDPIRAEARRWAQPIAAARCRIELTQLGEDAGLLGAARLAHERI